MLITGCKYFWNNYIFLDVTLHILDTGVSLRKSDNNSRLMYKLHRLQNIYIWPVLRKMVPYGH